MIVTEKGFLNIKIKRFPNVNRTFQQHFDNVILLPGYWQPGLKQTSAEPYYAKPYTNIGQGF